MFKIHVLPFSRISSLHRQALYMDQNGMLTQQSRIVHRLSKWECGHSRNIRTAPSGPMRHSALLRHTKPRHAHRSFALGCSPRHKPFAALGFPEPEIHCTQEPLRDFSPVTSSNHFKTLPSAQHPFAKVFHSPTALQSNFSHSF